MDNKKIYNIPALVLNKKEVHVLSNLQVSASIHARHMDKSGTKYKILSEEVQPDGSIIIEIKKQYNTSPVGDYLN